MGDIAVYTEVTLCKCLEKMVNPNAVWRAVLQTKDSIGYTLR